MICKVKSQKSKVKSTSQNLKVLSFTLNFLLFTFYFLIPVFAQDVDKLVALSKQIIEAKTNEDLNVAFVELKDLYFQENKYNEFVDFLKSLSAKKKTAGTFINYYIALTRYQELKYLEEKQMWDEYFARGNIYRDELTGNAEKVIDSSAATNPLNVYSRLLLWQLHKDQQDAFEQEALESLRRSCFEYAKSAKDIQPIKEAADKLLEYQERAKSKELYKVYADKVVSSEVNNEQLLSIAADFYQEGNLELSQNFYDVYIDRMQRGGDKEKIIPALISIAKSFAYQDGVPNDPAYAEKIFKKIEQLGAKKAFNQELIYMRAFNLEKAKEYPQAKDIYQDLVKFYPQDAHKNEAIFKTGMINTYILRDIKAGRESFEKLAQQEKEINAHVISGLYQLGLLSQWENDFTKAKDYYAKLLEKAGTNYLETVTLTRQRLKEIEDTGPIEYNLKTFLDISLKEEYSGYKMTKVDLKASIYRLKNNQQTNITSTTYLPESGCMQVEVQYLWSGHTGSAKPGIGQSSFDTSFESAGTKDINLVVVSPSGIIDRSLDLLDVY
jgi:hypothetical protein